MSSKRLSDGDWVPVFRPIVDGPIGADDALLGLWLRLRVVVGFRDRYYKGRRIEPGQMILADRKMQEYLYPAAENPPAPNTIKKRLDRLSQYGAISIEILDNPKGRLITVHDCADDNSAHAASKIDAAPDARVDAEPDARADADLGANRRRRERKQDRDLINTQSSSEKGNARCAADDDEGGLLDFDRPGRTWADAERVLDAYGVTRLAYAIKIAKQRGLTPADVIGAVFVAKTWGVFPRKALKPGAVLRWIEGNGWPREGVPTAADLKSQLAEEAQRKAEREQNASNELDRNQREAEGIRRSVYEHAAAMTPPPDHDRVLAVIAWSLQPRRLSAYITDAEREALDRWIVSDREQRRAEHEAWAQRKVQHVPFDENSPPPRGPKLASPGPVPAAKTGNAIPQDSKLITLKREGQGLPGLAKVKKPFTPEPATTHRAQLQPT